MSYIESKGKIGLMEIAKSSWAKHVESFGKPDAVVMEITNFCTSAVCGHCYIDAVRWDDKSGMFMDIVTANTWAQALASSPDKPKECWTTGGEPTMHPLLGSILGHLKENGFYNALVTKGERFADVKYCNWLTSLGDLDEVAVSIRGQGILHDLLMLSPENPLWELVEKGISSREQIETIKRKLCNAKPKHYDATVQGLVNLSAVPNLIIALNIDVQAAVDMEETIKAIKERGGRTDKIYLQIQQQTKRSRDFSGAIPNIWRQPTVEIIREYIDQAKRLKDIGLVNDIMIIDPLPLQIIEGLHLTNEQIYQPSAVPAISPKGELRDDVLFLN